MCSHKLISEKELKYFTYNFKKPINLIKLYFLIKINKRSSAYLGRPVISNGGTPTEKVSEYLTYILKPIMQNRWSYIKDSGDFLKEIKNIGKIPEGALLVTADVFGLYPVYSWDWLRSTSKRLNEKD